MVDFAVKMNVWAAVQKIPQIMQLAECGTSGVKLK
jgi:hypothetical protein